MSRDFGKKYAKTPRGILPSEELQHTNIQTGILSSLRIPVFNCLKFSIFHIKKEPLGSPKIIHSV